MKICPTCSQDVKEKTYVVRYGNFEQVYFFAESVFKELGGMSSFSVLNVFNDEDAAKHWYLRDGKST